WWSRETMEITRSGAVDRWPSAVRNWHGALPPGGIRTGRTMMCCSFLVGIDWCAICLACTRSAILSQETAMKYVIVVAAALLLAFVGDSPAPSQTSGKKIDKLMAAKLQNSQKLLEGIAIGDFKKITNSAEELLELTKTEEWLMHKTPRYQTHSNE